MPVKGDKIPMPMDFAAKFIEYEGHMRRLAEHYSVSQDTARRWRGDIKIKQFDLESIPKGRPAEMLAERDLDPERWCVRGLRVNEWEMAGEMQRQTRLDIVPRFETIHAAKTEGYKPLKPKSKLRSKNCTKVIVGDHQSPYHDPAMHQSFLNWLAEVKPIEGVIDGDLVDLPTRSKFPTRAKWNAAANICIESAWKIMVDYRNASPETHWVYLFGNHEQRMWDSIMRNDGEAADIRPAGEERPALSLDRLLHLDDLGIRYFDNYPHDVYKIAPDTAVIHGDKSKPGSGGTSQHEVKDRRYHVFHGHDHSQAITPFTSHDIDNKPLLYYGTAVGASCQVEGGLGYAVRPDWQNGAATATFDKDGNMTPELIHFFDGKLRWRGEKW